MEWTNSQTMTIWLVVITTVSLIQISNCADPVYTPQNLTDSVGNYADNASTITWADLPAGGSYITSEPKRISAGLIPFNDLVHWFINLVFYHGIPDELIEKALDGELMDDVVSNYTSYIQLFMGYVVCVGLGVLFLLIFPIIACCFCCCRCCCGNCGAKNQQSPEDANSKCKRCTFILIVGISSVFIFVGTVCVFVNNNNISTMIGNIPDGFSANVADMKTFANNTANSATHILTYNFDFLKAAIFRDFDNVGYLIGVPFKEDIDTNTNFTGTLANLAVLANTTLTINDSLTDVEVKKANFETSLSELNTSVEAVKANIDAIFVSCSGSCPATGKPDYQSASVDIDTSLFPDLTAPRTSVDDALAQNLTEQIENATREFDDIPNTVQNEANSSLTDLKNTINDFNDTIDDVITQISDVNDDINGPDDTYNLNEWIDLIQEYADMAKNYDNFRWYFGVTMSTLCLLVFVFGSFGVLLGFFGSSVKDPPSKRGCISNCGGIFLMICYIIIFSISTIMMLLTWITFVPGSPMYKIICEPITNLDVLENYVTLYNDRQVDPGKYFLGDMILDNDTIPLTVSGILSDCRDGQSGFYAFKLDEIYDLDELLNYTDHIDIQAEIDAINISLSDVSIYPTDLQTQLNDINDAVNISFADFYAELGNNISTTNLSSLADDLDAYAATVIDPYKTNLEAEATELRRIDNEEYTYVQSNITALNASVANMESTVSTIPTLIAQLDSGLQTADDYIQNNGSDVIKTLLTDYANRLTGIVDSFISYLKSAILNDLGSCRPLWNFYNSLLVHTLCYNTIDIINGFWFSLGWVLFFFMPAMIFSVKLKKYFRIMDEIPDEPPPPYSESKDPDGFRQLKSTETRPPSKAQFWMKKNKVAHRDSEEW
ncbi:Prominin 1 [Mactra antiquata]